MTVDAVLVNSNYWPLATAVGGEKMFRVVTVAREYGSGGGSIARLLAERLNWKLLDRCLVERIAQAASVDPQVAEKYDECSDPWFNRLAQALWQSPGLR